MLITKFKSERGQLKDNTEVTAARSKFSAKRKLSTVTEHETSEAKRCIRLEVNFEVISQNKLDV